MILHFQSYCPCFETTFELFPPAKSIGTLVNANGDCGFLIFSVQCGFWCN